MENPQLTDEEKDSLEKLREFHGLFKKLTRYLFTCQFCTRSTDVMAYDKEDAGRRIAEKKWQVMDVKLPRKNKSEKQKIARMLACRGCAKLFEDRGKAKLN